MHGKRVTLSLNKKIPEEPNSEIVSERPSDLEAFMKKPTDTSATFKKVSSFENIKNQLFPPKPPPLRTVQRICKLRQL